MGSCFWLFQPQVHISIQKFAVGQRCFGIYFSWRRFVTVSVKAHREETFGPSADTGKQDAAESSSLVYTSTPLKSSDDLGEKKSQQNLGKFWGQTDKAVSTQTVNIQGK